MAIFQLKTQNGFDFFEVASAMQKDIRRANEKDALYWGYEMIPRYENYLWKRLKVIVNEDIGIANFPLITAVQTLAAQYFEMRERKDASCTLCVTNAILLLCRSPKTRVGDHLTIIMEEMKARELESGKRLKEIPDYAVDMHTRRGKQLKRGLDHFRKNGAALVGKDKTVDDPYEDEAYKLLADHKKWPLEWPAPKREPKEKPEKPGAEPLLF
jgi:replication-associated recombination protein RarA